MHSDSYIGNLYESFQNDKSKNEKKAWDAVQGIALVFNLH